MPLSEVSVDGIAGGVHRLLTEEDFARQARGLSDEVRSMPSPNDLVPELERLTEKHRTRS
ncbi:hypothetical protein [Nocardiopsis sp. MG754419]|uniref:hypothetical protein n=1 Tax=Nocardiopsis sp. MG754419 TaxID=2259865 RepID=UPI0035B4CAC1